MTTTKYSKQNQETAAGPQGSFVQDDLVHLRFPILFWQGQGTDVSRPPALKLFCIQSSHNQISKQKCPAEPWTLKTIGYY